MRPKNSTFDTYTWIHEQLNNQELRKQQKNLLLSKEDYILWLEEFTSKYPIFSDTDWLYNSTDLEEKDQENINQISLLYEIIDTYAKANYLYPNSNQFICYYYLKVKQNYYQIGQSIIKPQPIYYCQKMNFP